MKKQLLAVTLLSVFATGLVHCSEAFNNNSEVSNIRKLGYAFFSGARVPTATFGVISACGGASELVSENYLESAKFGLAVATLCGGCYFSNYYVNKLGKKMGAKEDVKSSFEKNGLLIGSVLTGVALCGIVYR